MFSGPKRLLNIQSFERKGNLSNEEKILPYISKSIEHDKGQATTFKGPEGTLTSVLQAIWLVLLDLRSPEPNFSKKMLTSLWQKNLVSFSCYRVWQASGDNLEVSKRYFDNHCGSYKINTVTPKKLFKPQIFEKEGNLSRKRFFRPFFSYYRTWKTSGNNL